MPSTTDLRDGVDGISALAAAELSPVFAAGLSTYDLRAVLNELLPGLLDEYGLASGAYAADWYDEYRLERDVPGVFTAQPQPLPEPGVQQLVAWATEPLDAPVPDLPRARVQLDGGVQLRLANVTRQTVAEASYSDPRAHGWQRVGSGACPFCAMLIGRGAVYSERGASFAAHDHCHCSAVPAFDGQPVPVKPYTPSPRRVSDADRARVGRYLRDNDPDKPRAARPAVDVDAGRTIAQLRSTLASLERSLERFDSPSTRQRVDELRRKIAART